MPRTGEGRSTGAAVGLKLKSTSLTAARSAIPEMPASMRRPDRSDWGEIAPDDLDATHAFETFFGKSFDEARTLFEQNALLYQEDLLSMPKAAFEYYAPAYVEYLRSTKSQGDADAASCFLAMVSVLLKADRGRITGKTEKLLLETSAYIAQNQEFYDADIDIYGDFSKRCDEINSLVDTT